MPVILFNTNANPTLFGEALEPEPEPPGFELEFGEVRVNDEDKFELELAAELLPPSFDASDAR